MLHCPCAGSFAIRTISGGLTAPLQQPSHRRVASPPPAGTPRRVRSALTAPPRTQGILKERTIARHGQIGETCPDAKGATQEPSPPTLPNADHRSPDASGGRTATPSNGS